MSTSGICHLLKELAFESLVDLHVITLLLSSSLFLHQPLVVGMCYNISPTFSKAASDAEMCLPTAFYPQ